MHNCKICKRELSVTESIIKGIGPICAGKLLKNIEFDPNKPVYEISEKNAPEIYTQIQKKCLLCEGETIENKIYYQITSIGIKLNKFTGIKENREKITMYVKCSKCNKYQPIGLYLVNYNEAKEYLEKEKKKKAKEELPKTNKQKWNRYLVTGKFK